MLKTIVFSEKIRKMRKNFDGKTQAVRGELKKAKAARKEKHKQKWSRIVAYIAKCINVIMRDYDAVKISARAF